MEKLISTKLEPLDDIGRHMTMENFLECVKTGAFIDYDGYGVLATATHQGGETKQKIRPSDIKKGKNPDPYWTHVMWYNR